jgi:hypothetical protein
MPQGGLADERDKKVVMALWVSQQNSSRDDNYRHSGIIAATPVLRNKQEALPRQEDLSRLGKCMPLISYDASVGIDKKKAKTSSKNKQQKQAQPLWHVERASRAQHLQHEQRKWVGRQRQGHRPQQNNASARDDNSKYHLGGFHTKKQMWVVMLSRSRSRARAVPQNVRKKNLDNDLDWDDAFKDAILPILRLHLMQTSETGFKLKKPVLSTSRKPRVGKYNSTDFKTHSTKNWEY